MKAKITGVVRVALTIGVTLTLPQIVVSPQVALPPLGSPQVSAPPVRSPLGSSPLIEEKDGMVTEVGPQGGIGRDINGPTTVEIGPMPAKTIVGSKVIMNGPGIGMRIGPGGSLTIRMP